MGSLRGDNGGDNGAGRAPDGGGLPDLPPEWGTIIIPDDPAELSKESTAIRRELRRLHRRNRWRRRLHLSPLTEAGSRETPTLGLPILIMAIALVATVTSLFALAWPGPAPRPAPSAAPHTTASADKVPDITLFDADNKPVQLRNVLPAVLLVLAEGCDCADLELATAEEVPAGVTVLAVGLQAPALPSAQPVGLRIRALADPKGTLRATYGGSLPTSTTIAVLVRGTGEIAKTVYPVTNISDLLGGLYLLS